MLWKGQLYTNLAEYEGIKLKTKPSDSVIYTGISTLFPWYMEFVYMNGLR